jgi:hypothetical protein
LEPEREQSLPSQTFFARWDSLFSKLTTSFHDASSSQHPQNEANDASQIREPVSALVSAVIRDAVPPTPTPNEGQEARQERKERRDKKRLRVEIATLAVLSVYTIVTTGIWLATKSAAKSSATAAEAASKSASAAEGQVQATRESIEATVEQYRLDQRAWIGPTNFILKTMHAPDPISAIATIRNNGKTPALKMKVRYFLHASDEAINVREYAANPEEKRTGKEIGISTLFPNGEMELNPSTGSTDTLGVQSVQSGRKLLYFFGWISYLDVFNAEHQTRFCAQYRPGTSSFTPCAADYDYAN